MPIYLMSIRVLLSVELCVTLKTYLKGAPFYNAWKARLCFLRFPRKRKIPGFASGDFPVPSFPRPFRRQPQRREELAFRLLHALGGFGVAAVSRDALSD